MEKLETKTSLFTLSETERRILSVIGEGNMNEGLRNCIALSAHAYNLGWTVDMDLNLLGLVTVSSTDKYPHE
jgi:hypothetical protein